MGTNFFDVAFLEFFQHIFFVKTMKLQMYNTVWVSLLWAPCEEVPAVEGPEDVLAVLHLVKKSRNICFLPSLPDFFWILSRSPHISENFTFESILLDVVPKWTSITNL